MAVYCVHWCIINEQQIKKKCYECASEMFMVINVHIDVVQCMI